MAVETLSISLTTGITKVKYTDFSTGNANDTQTTTFLDGGNLSGTIEIDKFGTGTATEAGQGPGGDDVFIIDLSGFNDNFGFITEKLDSGDSFQIYGWDTHTISGTIHTFTYTGWDGGTYTFTIDALSENNNTTVDPNITIVCFARGTLIATRDGQTAVEDITTDTEVLTAGGAYRRVRWIGSTRISSTTLHEKPHLRPIRIACDTFGKNAPSRPLYVSPQHRILLRGMDVDLMFGTNEVLVAAKYLVDGVNITVQDDGSDVEYFHILFDTHEIVYSENLETESFFPGQVGISALDEDVKRELFELFPDLAKDTARLTGTCRPALKAYEMRALARFRDDAADRQTVH